MFANCIGSNSSILSKKITRKIQLNSSQLLLKIFCLYLFDFFAYLWKKVFNSSFDIQF